METFIVQHPEVVLWVLGGMGTAILGLVGIIAGVLVHALRRIRLVLAQLAAIMHSICIKLADEDVTQECAELRNLAKECI